MSSRHVLVLVLATLMVTSLGASAALGSPDARQTSTRIDSCTTITEPGFYVLDADIENGTATEETGYVTFSGREVSACLAIRTNDVVLDGADRTVDGTNATDENATEGLSIGVFAMAAGARSNVTVRNLTVTDWGQGVRFSDVTDGTIGGVTASENGLDGVLFERVAEGTVRGATAANNGQNGVRVSDSSGTSVERVEATDNGRDGIVIHNSRTVTVTDVTASRNAQNGVFLLEVADGRVADSRAHSNALHGIEFTQTESVTVSTSIARRNAYSGITSFGTSDGTVRRSIASGNRNGVFLLNASEVEVQDTVASNNDAYGYGLWNASGNRLTNVVAAGNGDWSYHSSAGSANNVVEGFGFDDGETQFSFTSRDVAVAPADPPANLPTGREVVARAVNVTGTESGAWLRLRVRYADAAVNGVDERTIRLWQHRGGEWSRVEGDYELDAAENVVAANVTRLDAILVPLGERTEATTRSETTNGATDRLETTTDGTIQLETATEETSRPETTQPETTPAEPERAEQTDTGTTAVSGETTEPDTTSPSNETTERTGTDESGASPFESPLVVQTADGTVNVGPPRDLDGDGLHEDVNGDGAVSDGDFEALFLIFSATQRGELELTPAQTAALDFDQDGKFDQSDLFAFRRLL